MPSIDRESRDDRVLCAISLNLPGQLIALPQHERLNPLRFVC
jgi:hypothetical protein